MVDKDVVIIGGGPSGLTAAIYSARSQLDTVVIEKGLPGGQIAQTNEVENYPGFESISGAELANKFVNQAQKFGAEICMDEVHEIKKKENGFLVVTPEKEITTKSVILAMGANPKKLGVPGENEFYGRGVSTCATCDGFFFKDKNVIVVGGGDAAIEEGLFLTKFAEKVTVIHRRNELRANKELQERAFKNEKMEFIWDSIVTEVTGDDFVSGVNIINHINLEQSFVEGEGVFIYIGHEPNTGFLDGFVDLNDNGYVQVENEVFTSVEGVFACGDVSDEIYRQLSTSVGTGTKAAMMLEKWIS